jgi:hypothetical protein
VFSVPSFGIPSGRVENAIDRNNLEPIAMHLKNEHGEYIVRERNKNENETAMQKPRMKWKGKRIVAKTQQTRNAREYM